MGCGHVLRHLELELVCCPTDLFSIHIREKMMQINVVLSSGRAELLSLPPGSTVQDILTQTQEAFGNTWLQLVTAENRVLVDRQQRIEETKIEDGECLTAAILADGSAVASQQRHKSWPESAAHP